MSKPFYQSKKLLSLIITFIALALPNKPDLANGLIAILQGIYLIIQGNIDSKTTTPSVATPNIPVVNPTPIQPQTAQDLLNNLTSTINDFKNG